MTEAEKQAQAEAENRAKAEAAARADAETPAWAKAMADSMSECMGRVDACMARMDSMEKSLIKNDSETEEEKKAREDKARKDAEEAAAADAARADYDKKLAEAQAARADAEKAAEAARSDSAALKTSVEALQGQVKALTGAVHISDADQAELTKAQARADEVALEFGQRAPRPMAGETPISYRRRLAAQYQPHSPKWKERDLAAVNDSVLDIAEEQIYADAVKVAQTAPEVPAGTLRAITRKDVTGRTITEFQGSMGAWMDQFKAPIQKQVSINNGSK
jgi:hypothetical protein